MKSTERVKKHRERKERGVLAVVTAEITRPILKRLVSAGYVQPVMKNGSPTVSRKSAEEGLQTLIEEIGDGEIQIPAG